MINLDLADEFLTTFYGNKQGYAFLGFKADGAVTERVYDWPAGVDQLLADVEAHGTAGDVFWCPLLRSTAKRSKGNATQRQWLWFDLDGPCADPHLLREVAPILVSTGRPRHLHGYVALSEPVDTDRWHSIARALRDRLGGDAKIADNDFLRLPGTCNFKPGLDQPIAELTGDRWREWDPDELEALIGPAASATSHRTRERVTGAVRVSERSLPRAVRTLMRDTAHLQDGDGRHKITYKLVRLCKEKGLSLDQTMGVVSQHEPSVEKFGDRLEDQVEQCWNAKGDKMPEKKVRGRRLVAQRASEVVPVKLRWAWEQRIPLGMLTLLAGREGLGKSTIAGDLVAQITRGKLDGEFKGTARNVIYAAASEDARDNTIVPRLMAAGADLDRIVFLDAFDEDDNQDFMVLPMDTVLLVEAIQEHEAALVVLDPATSAVDSRLDGNSDRKMRLGLEPMNRVANETNSAIVGIVHFGKADTSDTGKLILGSSAWSQVTRSRLALARDDETGHVILSVTKANLGPAGTPSLAAAIEETQVKVSDGITKVGRIQWIGETSRHVEDYLSGEAAANPDETVRWLEDYLSSAGGSCASANVKEAGETAGFKQRTIQRAALDRLKVKVTQEGFPRRTFWTLRVSDATSDTTCTTGATGATGTTNQANYAKNKRSARVRPRSSHANRASDASRACHDIVGATGTEARPRILDFSVLLGKGDYLAPQLDSDNSGDSSYDPRVADLEGADDEELS